VFARWQRYSQRRFESSGRFKLVVLIPALNLKHCLIDAQEG